MKRVLIITYYWPPSGGSGVQRWLQMTSFMKEFGWQPIVYFPKNANYQVIDESLKAEISPDLEQLSKKIVDPANFYSKIVGKKHQIGAGMSSVKAKKSIIQRFALWIRGNVFIPDSRKFWVKSSARFLHKYYKKNAFDAIISTGPPHSMHLIAMKLADVTGLPWIADFRDPWTNIDFFKDVNPGKRAVRKHKRLENEVLQKADQVIAVGNTLAQELLELGAKECKVITNGFDPRKFKNLEILPERDSFIISHIGLMSAARNPELLWEALAKLKKENEIFSMKLKICFAGKVDGFVVDAIKKAGLEDSLELFGNISHYDALNLQKKSAVLLLFINDAPNAKGILTGKVFEYLAANRPILAVGPEDGDVASIIEEASSGIMFARHRKTEIEDYLISLFKNFEKNKEFSNNREYVNKFSRREQTAQVSAILNSISGSIQN